MPDQEDQSSDDNSNEDLHSSLARCETCDLAFKAASLGLLFY